jgi:hypothetical protein
MAVKIADDTVAPMSKYSKSVAHDFFLWCHLRDSYTRDFLV